MPRGCPSTTGVDVAERRQLREGDEVGERATRELPVDEAVVRINAAGRRDAKGTVLACGVAVNPVGLDQQAPAVCQSAGQNAEEPERILDPMQKAEAEDEVEARVEVVECIGVHPPVVDFGAEQALDRVKALADLRASLPAISHPIHVLVVVDGEHPSRAARLGEESVEAVEGANVKDGETVK
jgi:hypothetical protein